MDLPFDGAISAYFNDRAPEALREAIEEGRKRDILEDDFPYDRKDAKAIGTPDASIMGGVELWPQP
ncbi:hypothetical protein [Pararhodobacter oceanensis]|uniref:hypothetical protein n=1 Tax=Pararhodobacter oceanensis TaxID=2172121 RepID=UPI003A8FE3DA